MKYLKLFEEHNRNYDRHNDLSDIISRKDFFREYYDRIDDSTDNKILEQAKNNALEKFKKAIPIFENIHIVWSDEHGRNNEALALYVHSSSLNSNPLIILFESAFNSFLDDFKDDEYEYEQEAYHAIETTIYHELGHAMCDIDNYFIFKENYNVLDYEDEEVFVETFARDFYSNGKVSDDILFLSDLFKTKKWIDTDDDYEMNY
jgi:hypothetical protein